MPLLDRDVAVVCGGGDLGGEGGQQGRCRGRRQSEALTAAESPGRQGRPARVLEGGGRPRAWRAADRKTRMGVWRLSAHLGEGGREDSRGTVVVKRRAGRRPLTSRSEAGWRWALAGAVATLVAEAALAVEDAARCASGPRAVLAGTAAAAADAAAAAAPGPGAGGWSGEDEGRQWGSRDMAAGATRWSGRSRRLLSTWALTLFFPFLFFSFFLPSAHPHPPNDSTENKKKYTSCLYPESMSLYVDSRTTRETDEEAGEDLYEGGDPFPRRVFFLRGGAPE